VTAGTTYYIVVDGYAGSRGSFALRVTPPGASTTTTTAPTTTSTTTTSSTTSTTLAGAACGSATVIPAGSGSFTGSTSGASTLAGTCGSSGTAPEKVFQWTPTTSGTATIQTCGAGTNYDSVLYVRSPTCTSPEVTAGCNDDACPNASGLFRASKVMPSACARPSCVSPPRRRQVRMMGATSGGGPPFSLQFVASMFPLRRRGATRAPHGEPRDVTLSRPAVTKCLAHACAIKQWAVPHGEPRGDPGSGPHNWSARQASP